MECPATPDREPATQRPVPAPDLYAHLEASVHAASDAIIGTDRNGNVIAWNPAAERLYGRSPGEAIGQPLTSFIAPRSPDAAPVIARALAGHDVPSTRIRHVAEAGIISQQILSIAVGRDARGAVNTLSVTIHAPTEHHTIVHPEQTSAAAMSFRSIVDRLPVAVFLVVPDARQTRLYVSPAVTTITGYTPDEFARQSLRPGWHWTDSVHPQDRARVAAEDAQGIAAGSTFQMEYRYIRKDGSVAWVRDICVPIHDDTGEIGTWLGMLLDITDEMEAARTRAHLAAIVEAAEDGILSVAEDGAIASWNEGAARIYGYSAEEAIGQPVAMLRPPESASEIGVKIAPVWDGAVLSRYETERMTRDGRRIPVSLSVFPIRNADGDIVATSSITHDLSALRQAEAGERLRIRALDAAQCGVVIMDATLPEHLVVDVNPAFSTLTGYARDDVLGRNCGFLQGPDTDPEVVTRLSAAISQGRDTNETLLSYRRDGTTFWNNLSLAAVHDVSGALTHFVGILNDVTDRVRLEQELRNALSAAEAGNASKTLFLAMMSHELRTPLQSIIGYAEMLLEPRSGRLSKQQQEDVQAIGQGAYRMVDLVEQLLDVSRMQFGPLPVRHESVDLEPVIDTVVRDLTPELARKELQISCNVPADTPPVLGDAGRIAQVLSTIIGNAVKFTHAGRIHIAVQPADDVVSIHVRDTGIGIAEDRLPYIFEAFRQAHVGLNRPYEGAGVGLTIAERLVQQMHGGMAVQSTPGEGSTFTVWFPIAEP